MSHSPMRNKEHTMSHADRIDDLAAQIHRARHITDRGEQRIALILLRLLAAGAPVPVERLSETLALPTAEIEQTLEQWPEALCDQLGRATGGRAGPRSVDPRRVPRTCHVAAGRRRGDPDRERLGLCVFAGAARVSRLVPELLHRRLHRRAGRRTAPVDGGYTPPPAGLARRDRAIRDGWPARTHRRCSPQAAPDAEALPVSVPSVHRKAIVKAPTPILDDAARS